MQINKLNILKFLFFLGVGILLIWLATRDLTDETIQNVKYAIKHADYFWVFISLFLSILSHVSRAMRWKILLQPLGFNPKLYNTFFAVMVGYLANFALPRLGEVSRCGILTRYEKIPFTEGFGTVVAERVIDLICLIIIFFATLIFQFDELWNLSNENIIEPLNKKLSLLMQHPFYAILTGFTIIALVLVFLRFKKKSTTSVSNKFLNLLKGLIDGLKSIKDIKHPYLFIMHTIIIWFLYTFSLYIGFLCFKETGHLSADACFAVLIFSTLGVILVPGGIGASPALVTKTLTSIFKISYAVAVAFAWLMWASQFILMLLFGLLSLILLPVFNKTATTEKG